MALTTVCCTPKTAHSCTLRRTTGGSWSPMWPSHRARARHDKSMWATCGIISGNNHGATEAGFHRPKLDLNHAGGSTHKEDSTIVRLAKFFVIGSRNVNPMNLERCAACVRHGNCCRCPRQITNGLTAEVPCIGSQRHRGSLQEYGHCRRTSKVCKG